MTIIDNGLGIDDARYQYQDIGNGHLLCPLPTTVIGNRHCIMPVTYVELKNKEIIKIPSILLFYTYIHEYAITSIHSDH